MDDTNSTSTQTTADQGQAGTGETLTPTPELVQQLQAEVDKWKALSRTNEKRWHDASSEVEKLRQAQMTDAERALEQARTEGRQSALSEVGARLVDAELRAQAATAGVQLPPAEFINTAKFLNEDGTPNSELISQFVSSIPKPTAGPEFSQDIGLGRQGSPIAGQLTREDLSRMTPAEIVAARKEGKLDALMRGEI
ncbi:hypothetical protein [Streptomyces sp. URMC 125]|uniref:hypothetical protein n=1 Tax=Streptomyces sp. URMC 125 TaxID=3423419 RepID=UPI003F1BD4EE